MTAEGSTVLLERVRKLLAKAERTEHPHEADAFSAKAAELIAAHRITPEALAAARSTGRLALMEIPLGRGAYVRARLGLLMAVAEGHDADVVFRNGPNGMTAIVAGFADDLDVVRLLFDSLHTQAAGRMAAGTRRTAAATQRWRRAFLFGYAQRVGELLRAAHAEAESAAVAPFDADGVTAEHLAVELRERRARVNEFTASSFGRVSAASRPAPAAATGWADGRTAAERADLGRARLDGRAAIGPRRS